MTDRLAEIEARHAAFERIAADPEARAGYDGSYDAHMDRGWLIAMVKVANRGSESLRKFNERATGRNQELERQLTDALAAHATILKECQKLISERDTARARIAALEGELELARQGQRDARAGMDYAISKGRGEAANFCARIDALLKERDEARRELKQAREQIHAQGRELVVAIESLRSAREVIDRRDRHGEEMEERIAALERENAELRDSADLTEEP